MKLAALLAANFWRRKGVSTILPQLHIGVAKFFFGSSDGSQKEIGGWEIQGSRTRVSRLRVVLWRHCEGDNDGILIIDVRLGEHTLVLRRSFLSDGD